jgi:2-hydroxychromene-2-carboxylate isomerase
MTKSIDYFYSVGSPWAYIGFDAFLELAAHHKAEVRPHIIPLIEENGAIYSRNRPDARRAYWFRDLARWAALRNKPLTLENRAGLSDPTPAGRLVVAAQIDGLDWISLTKALQEALWGRAEDIGNVDVRASIITKAGFDAETLETRIGDIDVQTVLDANFQRAKEAGVFGIPTFRYEGELYWGQDSLPILERHLAGEPILA